MKCINLSHFYVSVICIFFVSFFFAQNLICQEKLSSDILEIKSAFEKGNAKLLANSFQQSINLDLLSQSGTYNSDQAENLLNDFFKKYAVESFRIQKSGETGSLTDLFTIGELVCGSDRFRVYFVRSKEGAKYLIHSLSITAIKK
ncbi:MAG: DUF4783 domain-containing protein [Bacteroidales bacterium]